MWRSCCLSHRCTSLSFYLWPVCLSLAFLRVSQWDPRLSMQPVMRCMLQSACEELIREQQRPAHINRHECVHAYVCLRRVWRLGSLPGTLKAVCRPMRVLIWRGRQTEMNSDLQRDSTVHVWVCKVYVCVCLCVTECVCACIWACLFSLSQHLSQCTWCTYKWRVWLHPTALRAVACA